MHTIKQIKELNMNNVTNLELEYYFSALFSLYVSIKVKYEQLYCELLLHTCICVTFTKPVLLQRKFWGR